MKSKLLLSSKYKLIGLLILIPFMILGLWNLYFDFHISFLNITVSDKSLKSFDFSDNNLTNEVALSGVIISLLMIAFSKEKKEDEFINRLRLESWQWAVLINFLILLIVNWLIYGTAFLQVMIYNMLTVLIIFIVRFHWLLMKYKKQVAE